MMLNVKTKRGQKAIDVSKVSEIAGGPFTVKVDPAILIPMLGCGCAIQVLVQASKEHLLHCGMGSMRNMVANLNYFLQKLRALSPRNRVQCLGDNFALKKQQIDK